MRLSFYKFQGMQSLCKICFFSFISLVAACTVPVRTGYDRELGEYAPPPESTSTTVNLSPSGPDSSIYSDENISPVISTPGWLSSNHGSELATNMVEVLKAVLTAPVM
jgi:hypothetical protein